MKMNMSKTVFLLIISLSALISFSINNWLTLWILMELTLFMFIPLLSKNKINDQSMKYFIIQSFSSYLLIFAMLWNSMNLNPINSLISLISLLMKVGLAPFHLWKPEVMSKISWKECMLMTTLIKIIPMILMNKLITFKMIVFPMILSLIVGATSGINQLNLKKMMAYSSIFNLTWMTSSFLVSKKIMLMFLIMYFFLNIKIMNFFKKNNLIYMNQIMFLPLKLKLNLNLNLLSISGLPPLTGFFPKWIIMNELMKSSIFLPTFMILTSMISIFMYLQINTFSLSNFFIKKKNNKMIFNPNLSILNLLIFPVMLLIWMN